MVDLSFDNLAGSIDESVARQFDDKPGGGFADEAMRLADPTDRASEQTEADAALAAQGATVAAPWAGVAGLGAMIGTGGRNDPVDESDSLPQAILERAGTGAGEAGSRANQEFTNQVLPDWVPQGDGSGGSDGPGGLPFVEGAFALAVIGLGLWLIRPLLEIVAGATE